MSTNTKNNKTNNTVVVGSLKPGDKFRYQRLVCTVNTSARNGVWYSTSKGKDRIAPKTEVTLIERAKGVSKTAPKKAAAPTKKAETPAKKKAPAKPNTPRKAPGSLTKGGAGTKAAPSKPRRGRRPVKGTKPNLPANVVRVLSNVPNDIEWEYKGKTVIVWPIWDDQTLTNKYGTGYPVKDEDAAETLSAAMESGEFFKAVYVMEKPKGVFSVKCVGGEVAFKALNLK